MSRGKEMETREEYIQLADSCDFLERYHMNHTFDMVTRFRGKNGRPDIYVVGDPQWKERMGALCAPIFPDTRRAKKSMDPTPQVEPKP